MSEQGYETLAGKILGPLFWREPLPDPLELIDPTETREDGSLVHRLTGNQEFLWLVTLYGLDPAKWAGLLLAFLAGQQRAFMGDEPNAAHPYFELYGRALAAGLRFADGRSEGVHEALIGWARSLLALCALGRLADGRIVLPGGRISDPHSADRDEFVKLLMGHGDPSGHPRGSAYPQAVSMLASVIRTGQVWPPGPGPLPGLLWPMQVEIYERGVRMWFEHLCHPSGGPPRTPGFPWWAMAANRDGSRVEHVSWLTMGLPPERAKGGWRRRSLEIPSPVPAWDMGRRVESFVVGPNGREEVGGGGPIAPPVEPAPPRPPKPPRRKPRKPPKGEPPAGKLAEVAPHEFLPLAGGNPRQCHLCYHGQRAHPTTKPVPARVPGDLGKRPPGKGER